MQLGADPARAVLIDLPDSRAAEALNLLDGSRSERTVLQQAIDYGLAPDEARTLIETLTAAGFVRSAQSLAAPAPALAGESAALALRLDPPPALRPNADRPSCGRPGASPPNASPPNASPSNTSPRHASPPNASRPNAGPPEASPPEASPPGARPPNASPPNASRPNVPSQSALPAATPSARTPAPPARSPIPPGPAPAFQLPTAVSPARILRRRAAARVLVTGHGRLGAPIACALAEAGVGHVVPDLPGIVGTAELAGSALGPPDVGQPRAEAVAAAVTRAAPHVRTGRIRRGTASVVIQLRHDQPVALLAAAHLQRRQPHLAVTILEGVPAIGPFVPATGSPCLNCIDLHRRERDPGWSNFLPAAEPCAVATALAAAALATADALAFLDGETPQTLGATIEIRSPGHFRRRTWHPHPACPCTRIRR